MILIYEKNLFSVTSDSLDTVNNDQYNLAKLIRQNLKITTINTESAGIQ